MNKVSLVQVSCCSNTGSIRDDPYWTSRKNSLELIELSSVIYALTRFCLAGILEKAWRVRSSGCYCTRYSNFLHSTKYQLVQALSNDSSS